MIHLIPTALFPGSNSTTRSTSKNGYRWGRIFDIWSLESTVFVYLSFILNFLAPTHSGLGASSDDIKKFVRRATFVIDGSNDKLTARTANTTKNENIIVGG